MNAMLMMTIVLNFAFLKSSSVFGEHRLLVLLSISFYLLEHYESEITDLEFKKNFLKVGRKFDVYYHTKIKKM